MEIGNNPLKRSNSESFELRVIDFDRITFLRRGPELETLTISLPTDVACPAAIPRTFYFSFRCPAYVYSVCVHPSLPAAVYGECSHYVSVLQITKLKIDSNPFAKGFRDSSRLTDMERYCLPE